MTSVPLVSILIGKALPIGPSGTLSGIAKSPCNKPVHLSGNGLAGDEQGDAKRHGGPEKALHHHPFEHYRNWTNDLGLQPLLGAPGAFGENVATKGLNEKNVAVGDVFKLGDAIVQVSQGRQPCWKLNERFGRKDMARQVQRTGRTGWYYRVLEPGLVRPEDALVLIDRPTPDWTLERVWHAFYVDTLNTEELAELVTLKHLTQSWRDHAQRRIENKTVEDWTARLDGQSGARRSYKARPGETPIVANGERRSPMIEKRKDAEVSAALAVPIGSYGLAVFSVIIYLVAFDPEPPTARLYLPEKSLIQENAADSLCNTSAKVNVSRAIHPPTTPSDCI